MIYILFFTIAMFASAACAAWKARERKEDKEENEDAGECGFERCDDYVEQECSTCGRLICADETGEWVDNDGGVTCGTARSPHTPR